MGDDDPVFLSMGNSVRRIFLSVFSRILELLLIAHEIIMGDALVILVISSYGGQWCTISRPAIQAELRFNHYFSVTAIGGFCDGIHGVIQGIPGGDNGA